MPFAPAATISPSRATATAERRRQRHDGRRRRRRAARCAASDHTPALTTDLPSGVNATPLTFCYGLRARAALRRRAARAAPCDPTRPTRATRRRAKPRARRSARCALPAPCRAAAPVAPDRDAAVRARRDGAAVAQQRDRVHGVVVEAQHLLAALRVSDQRIAELSKLPEIALAPSADTATARTGPPWPRNCACAGALASATMRALRNNFIAGVLMAVPGGVEPPTFGLGNRCSIRLSYGTRNRPLAIISGSTRAAFRHAQNRQTCSAFHMQRRDARIRSCQGPSGADAMASTTRTIRTIPPEYSEYSVAHLSQ